MDIDPVVVSVWARLFRIQMTGLGRVEAALAEAGFPPLAWYDVLLELERAEAPLKPGALQDELLLAQSNLSRLLDRMERRDLIERAPDPNDGRSRLIVATAKGRALRRSMWTVYAKAIQEVVGQRLTREEAVVLDAGLKLLVRER